MGYEKRAIRPFNTMDQTQRLLNYLLRVQSPRIPDGYLPPMGNQALKAHGVEDAKIAAANGALILSSEEFVTNSIGLYFGVHEDDWLQVTQAAVSDLEMIFGRVADAPVNLLVSVANTRLRQTQVLLNVPFSEWLANEESWRWTVVQTGNSDTRPRPLRMPTDGCSVSIQFVLREHLPEKLQMLGRPWRKGSWLARWDVRVSATKGSGLAPRPLTQEVRDAYQLGNACTSYIDLRGERSGLCFVNDLTEVLSVYIDQDLLMKSMQLNNKGLPARAAGEAIVHRIVMDTYRSLVHALTHDDQLTDFDVDSAEHRYTFTYQLLQRASDYASITDSEALNILRESPNRFIALIEGSMNLLTTDNLLLDLRA